MDNVTVTSLIELFQYTLEHLEEANEDMGYDPEYQYIQVVLETLKLVELELGNFSLDEQAKLAIAAGRVPGLLYLYQLY